MPRSSPVPHNPFSITTLARGDSFTDREQEVERMVRAFQTPGSKLVVYGDRRLGKTSALERAAELARTRHLPVATVSLATASGMEDAVNRLLAAIQASVGRTWRSAITDLASRLRLGVSITPSPDGTGVPGVSISVDAGAGPNRLRGLITDALDEIEGELEARDRHLGLGLDEFQRLMKWGGEDLEWALKASFEKHRRLSYVLAGSARGMIEAMISDKRRALWKTVDTLDFGPIDPEHMAAWMVSRAKASGVPLSPKAARSVVGLAGPRTRDIIMLAAATWELTRTKGPAASAAKAMDLFVRQTDSLHRRTWDTLKERPQRIVRVIAARPGAPLTSSEVRARYKLGAPSTVWQALSVMVQDELLVHHGGRYEFDDPFFRRWVQLNTLADIGLQVPKLAAGPDMHVQAEP